MAGDGGLHCGFRLFVLLRFLFFPPVVWEADFEYGIQSQYPHLRKYLSPLAPPHGGATRRGRAFPASGLLERRRTVTAPTKPAAAQGARHRRRGSGRRRAPAVTAGRRSVTPTWLRRTARTALGLGPEGQPSTGTARPDRRLVLGVYLPGERATKIT